MEGGLRGFAASVWGPRLVRSFGSPRRWAVQVGTAKALSLVLAEAD